MSTGRFRKGRWVSLPVIMLAIVAFSILAPERSEAASVECFIKFPPGAPPTPPVDGESFYKKEKGWIFVPTWGFGESAPTMTAMSMGRAAGALMQDFRFTSLMGTHSPRLFLGGLTGTLYREVIFACQKPGPVPFEFLRITLNEVVVKGYQSETPTTVGSPPMPMADTYPIDQVSLVFGRIRISYSPQLPDGHAAPKVDIGWDVKANKVY